MSLKLLIFIFQFIRLELEIDEFNRHPCMKILIKVIDRLHSQLTKPADPVELMPGWMNDMYKKFTNIGNENKGKLLLVK